MFQQAIMRAFSLIRDQHPTWYTFLFYSLLDKEYAPLQDAFRDQDLRLATQVNSSSHPYFSSLSLSSWDMGLCLSLLVAGIFKRALPTLFFCHCFVSSCLNTQSLRRWPMSLVDWPVNNSERIDITISPYLYREELQVAERAFPPDQRSCLWWNCCRRVCCHVFFSVPFHAAPFIFPLSPLPDQVLVSGSGMTEYSPAAWLLPYWYGSPYSLLCKLTLM